MTDADDTQMDKCIYCGTNLIQPVKLAHIFPEGLGGRLTSTTTVCNLCNESFAAVEGECSTRLAPHVSLLGARRGNRKMIGATLEHEGSRWRVENGRMDELVGPPRERGRIVPIPAGRKDQIGTIVAALRSQGLPAEAMLDGRFVFERDPSMDDTPIDDIQAEPIENSLLWGDRVTKRLMLKIAIELLAYFDGSAARCDELIAARRFARYDEGDDWEFRAGPDMETSGAKLKHIDATYIHGIEIWTAGNRLNYMMIILSKMHWVGTLSHSWKCGPFRAAYSFDIRDPGNKCVEHDKSDGATLVNKSFRVRMAELQKATVLLTETIKQHAERRRMRAPAPDLNDLYPEVAAAMNKSKK